jgi:hypothetical protein
LITTSFKGSWPPRGQGLLGPILVVIVDGRQDEVLNFLGGVLPVTFGISGKGFKVGGEDDQERGFGDLSLPPGRVFL